MNIRINRLQQEVFDIKHNLLSLINDLKHTIKISYDGKEIIKSITQDDVNNGMFSIMLTESITKTISLSIDDSYIKINKIVADNEYNIVDDKIECIELSNNITFFFEPSDEEHVVELINDNDYAFVYIEHKDGRTIEDKIYIGLDNKINVNLTHEDKIKIVNREKYVEIEINDTTIIDNDIYWFTNTREDNYDIEINMANLTTTETQYVFYDLSQTKLNIGFLDECEIEMTKDNLTFVELGGSNIGAEPNNTFRMFYFVNNCHIDCKPIKIITSGKEYDVIDGKVNCSWIVNEGTKIEYRITTEETTTQVIGDEELIMIYKLNEEKLHTNDYRDKVSSSLVASFDGISLNDLFERNDVEEYIQYVGNVKQQKFDVLGASFTHNSGTLYTYTAEGLMYMKNDNEYDVKDIEFNSESSSPSAYFTYRPTDTILKTKINKDNTFNVNIENEDDRYGSFIVRLLKYDNTTNSISRICHQMIYDDLTMYNNVVKEDKYTKNNDFVDDTRSSLNTYNCYYRYGFYPIGKLRNDVNYVLTPIDYMYFASRMAPNISPLNKVKTVLFRNMDIYRLCVVVKKDNITTYYSFDDKYIKDNNITLDTNTKSVTNTRFFVSEDAFRNNGNVFEINDKNKDYEEGKNYSPFIEDKNIRIMYVNDGVNKTLNDTDNLYIKNYALDTSVFNGTVINAFVHKYGIYSNEEMDYLPGNDWVNIAVEGLYRHTASVTDYVSIRINRNDFARRLFRKNEFVVSDDNIIIINEDDEIM